MSKWHKIQNTIIDLEKYNGFKIEEISIAEFSDITIIAIGNKADVNISNHKDIKEAEEEQKKIIDKINQKIKKEWENDRF